jgi:hypothetical protein
VKSDFFSSFGKFKIIQFEPWNLNITVHKVLDIALLMESWASVLVVLNKSNETWVYSNASLTL